MKLKTDLGQHLYKYSSLRKEETPPEIVQELSEAYCVREGFPKPTILYYGSGIATVVVDIPETRLDVYTKFRSAFFQHGYTPPFLRELVDEDPCSDQESVTTEEG